MRDNLDQLIMTYFDEARINKVLSRTRAYIGDYMMNGVKLQREIAALVVEKQGYPLYNRNNAKEQYYHGRSCHCKRSTNSHRASQ